MKFRECHAVLLVLVFAVLVVACDGSGGLSGEIGVLTYNVAGLPAELSGSDPVANMPQIAPLLNEYDLVLVQEDFWYHAALDAGTTHPYKSPPMWEVPDWDRIGDGLNSFSSCPFGQVTRVPWEKCNGLVDSGGDCMTTKGFMYARFEVGPGVVVDVYNLHMDASGAEDDILARKAQSLQLAAFINANSEGVAVLLAGDTNLKATRPDDLQTLDDFLALTGLVDSCRFLECGDERIDRVMFRSSTEVLIEPLEWSLPPEFVDAEGNQLSDHLPVYVLFSWKVIP